MTSSSPGSPKPIEYFGFYSLLPPFRRNHVRDVSFLGCKKCIKKSKKCIEIFGRGWNSIYMREQMRMPFALQWMRKGHVEELGSSKDT
jgi:hypothetical protein